MKDLEILDKWFLENENCTYKEFCDIYTLGEESTENLPFLELPKFILNILQKDINQKFVKVLPQRLVDFLIQEKALDNYIRNIVKRYKTISDFIRTIGDLNSSYIIDRSFNWSATSQGHRYWSNLNTKYKHL